MITTLNIKNVGIIDEVTIDFNKGLNVLTGETGAGKTLIIDAISIICGGRFSKEMIRTGEKQSYVEVCIYYPNNKYSEEENVIVSREINMSGKNLCKINGRLVTVNELKEFMQNVIDIHGQHDNQAIMQLSNHIKYLDSFSGKKLVNLKDKYRSLYEEYKELKYKLSKNFGDDIEKRRMLDLLEYQLNEIESASLVVGEEEELENRLKLIKSSEKITQNLRSSYLVLSDNVASMLDDVMKSLGKIEDLDTRYAEKLSVVKSSYYDLLDVSSELSDYSNEMTFDEEELNNIQIRIDLINSLKRKYGYNEEEIIKYAEDIRQKIDNINNLDQINTMLKNRIASIREEMKIVSLEMNEIRKEKGTLLEEKINKELKDLEMKNARFKVNITESLDFNKDGLDEVEFLVSTNVGDDFKPLVKVASGGEISRIMLAIKTIISAVDNIPVMIFDEIDTGISGTAAKALSEKIEKISKNSQILCVTHLAVVAAKADYNYYISKKVCEDKTKTSVKLLDEESTIKEIARIASGDINSIALEHAKLLRKNKLNVNA